MTGKKTILLPVAGILLMLLVLTPTAAAAATITEYPNTNLPGSDYKTIDAPSRMDCAMACLSDDQCKAATWVNRAGQTPSCQLKNAVPSKMPVSGDNILAMHSYIKNDAVVTPESTIQETGLQTSEFNTIKVNTVPAGASLFIDGNAVGKTPVSMGIRLSGGVHRIRLSMAGYSDYTDDVTLNPGQVFDLKVTMTKTTFMATPTTTSQPPVTAGASDPTSAGTDLKNALRDPGLVQQGSKAAGAGTLIISSNPSGAGVYLDGKSAGNTPLTIPDVPAGQHALLLTLQGYSEASRTVNISAGSENLVAVDLSATKKTPGFAGMAGILSFALLVLFRKRTG